jgi:aryl-alcohol dehydrogenase-like predicted oxidoreductase
MERRPLGSTGIDVPIIGMGTWRTFDIAAHEEPAAARVVAAALDAGTRLFDSSPMYGRSEGVLGRALAGRRGEAIVATKVWSEDDDEAERQLSFSLRTFGGTVDLHQVHNLVRWERRLDTLERLRADGRVRAVGATHYAAGAFGELMRAMRTGRLDAIQVPYNPWQREVESEVLPLAAELGLGVLVMRPFGEGSLLRRDVDADALAPLHRLGVRTWAQALLVWALSDARVTAVLPATASPEHVLENTVAGRALPLGPDERELVARLA